MQPTSPTSDFPPPADPSRRSFLQKTVMATAGAVAGAIVRPPVYGQSQAPSVNVVGANERIAVGYIGAGAQGQVHIRSQKSYADETNIVQRAVCDVYQKRLDEARALAELPEADAVRDYRRLLERKDIDAVIISAVDHWHADMAVDAMEAGKHVYGEKPLARYLGEGFRIHDAVKRTGRVFALGSQLCNQNKYRQGAQWVREGKLGPLVWAQGSYCRNHPNNSEWTFPVDPGVTAENLGWEAWLGRTTKRPFEPERYFSWHKYYDYNSGLIGDLLPHTLTPLMQAANDMDFPRRVVCTGTRKVSTDREITDTTHFLAEMPSGITYCIAGSTVNAVGLPETLRGRKGTIFFTPDRDHAAFKPERPFLKELQAEETQGRLPGGPLTRHQKDFFDSIRAGKEPLVGIDLAIRMHTILCLAEMSERLGLALFFDPSSRSIRSGDGRIIPALDYDSYVPVQV